jgi:hypothetical protein
MVLFYLLSGVGVNESSMMSHRPRNSDSLDGLWKIDLSEGAARRARLPLLKYVLATQQIATFQEIPVKIAG